MANVFISVPILDRPEFKMMHSLYQYVLTSGKHQCRIYVNENDSLISRVRNVHLSVFLNEFPECDYFCSIDSDIEIVNCFSSNNIFNKLIEADKDFIGGLYALKQHENIPLCSSVPASPDINRSSIKFNSGIIEMLWLSSGCWMIKRSALEKMVAAYPELTYTGDDNMAGKTLHGLCIPAIFEMKDPATGKVFKKYLSEDWAMTARWKAIGGKVYADTSIVLKHIGKIPYSLWNVEVVAKRREDLQREAISNLGLPRQGQQFQAPTPLSLKDLPPVGFDLQKLTEMAK
jgi:hypothetical protein